MSREASSQGFLIESGETLDSSKTEDVRGKKLRQPDSYWSWIVCAVGAISDVIVLGSAYCFGMIFPHLLEEFKQGKSNTAWVGSFAMSASGLFGPLAGRLTNHFGARIVVACGSLICAGGLLFTSVVPGLHLMFLTYGGIFGFGSSLVYMAIYEIVPRYFVKNRSVATGIITMSVGGALVVMTPVCEALLTAFGWRRTFAGLGCLAFLVFLTSWVFDPNVADDETHAAVKDFKEPIDKHREKVLDLSMWKNRSFVVLNLSQLVIYTGHHLVPLHLAKYCEDLGIEEDQVIWLYMCIGLVSLLARLPGSKLCDVISPLKVLFVFAIVSALSALLLPLATTLIRLLCYASVYGLADGMMAIGGILCCLQMLTPKQKAQGLGFYLLFNCIAFLCGPPIGGLIAEKTNSYHAAFRFASGLEFLGLFNFGLYLCLNEKLSRKRIEIEPETTPLATLCVIEKETVL
ncbi:unnamed protein product [Porites lobata]|uniref:Major facilitator superfamily (MFS) profile domain-containing protein n=1 Tax=Porites lobata TaxID=104759 RepID=A0ABN8QYM1_9CNID|nr:unnamed protein product [Porites lobata]